MNIACYVRMTGLVAKMPSSVLMGIGIWVGTVGVDSSPKEIGDAGRTDAASISNRHNSFSGINRQHHVKTHTEWAADEM